MDTPPHSSALIEENSAYQALRSHDPRFDGVFYVGVLSTGIYCRPVCPAKTPLRQNCRFFGSAEAAEKALFRPCLRCRPELAPGLAPIDHGQRIAQRLLQLMDEEGLQDARGLEDIAGEFEISSRQLRRIIQKELGVSPIELIQTRRLLLAKQLLTETTLPVTEVAFASGFSSLRRFNDAFSHQYRMPPSHLRKEAAGGSPSPAPGEASSLQLTYRPPYDWEAMLQFLGTRAIKGIEHVTEDRYLRIVQLGATAGWISVSHQPARRALVVQFSNTLSPALPALLGRMRHLFDLTARPDLISALLQQDERLQASVMRHPGLRVPGAFDGFEMAIRAILGQQITVKAATTLASRFAEAFGTPMDTPHEQLTRLPPKPETIARLTVPDIASLGIIRTRATSIIALAEACASGTLSLHPGTPMENTLAALVKLPGIGPWTANYIAMRALRWPDAFPKEDIVIRQRLGNVSSKQAEIISQAWSPWRSYAVMHFWKSGPP